MLRRSLWATLTSTDGGKGIWCFSLEIQTIRWGRRENPDRYLWRSSGRSASEGVVVLMSIHVQRGQEVVEHCMPSLRRRREDNSISAELWNRRVVLTRDSLLTLIREDEIKIPFLPSACIFLTCEKDGHVSETPLPKQDFMSDIVQSAGTKRSNRSPQCFPGTVQGYYNRG